jgi:hypothetical protein
MMRIEGQSSGYWLPAPATGIAAASPCPLPGLNQHRLAETPVTGSLLGHLPGSIPYSTHVEIAAARSRLMHREVNDALENLGAKQVEFAGLTTASAPVARDPRGESQLKLVPNLDLVGRGVAYTLPRRRWPVGGLVDLVI